jgi:hypothetical protein
MSLKIAEQGLLVYAPVSLIWENIYQMARWSHWNESVRKVELLETPKADAIGQIYPVTGRPYRFRLTRVIPHHVLAFERSFRLGTKLTQSFSLVRNVEGAIITVELFCEGRWEKQVNLFTRRSMTESLIRQIMQLKDLSEKSHQTAKQAEKRAEKQMTECPALETGTTCFDKTG